MIQFGRGLSFETKTTHRLRITPRRWDGFDRHLAIKSDVFATKDGPHASDTDKRFDPKVIQLLPDQRFGSRVPSQPKCPMRRGIGHRLGLRHTRPNYSPFQVLIA
jgi:hypothetical protein